MAARRQAPYAFTGEQPRGPSPTQAPAGRSPHRRRALACIRCRRRKVRCDGAEPACSNCAKAGEECFAGRAASAVSRNRLYYLEQRVRELEGVNANSSLVNEASHLESNRGSFAQAAGQAISPVQDPDTRPPEYYSHGHQNGQVHNIGADSPAISLSSQITRDQPLAHEVGLLSLSNTTDPKYLGPSSGVTFARLIYESAPQSQGLPLSFLREQEQRKDHQALGSGLCQRTREAVVAGISSISIPSIADCQQYADAFFEATPFYPLISQESFYKLLGQIQEFNESAEWDCRVHIRLASAQLLLVLSLGARFLETRLGTDYGSRDLFVYGMSHCSYVNLQDSIEGVQVLLLMVLHSFYNPEGLNAWYLLHTIIASCLDLGLQRRDHGTRPMAKQCPITQTRSAIFWSAYSMDRTLTTILGRPLTLRDEAIDQSFPGLEGSEEVEETATQWQHFRNTPQSNQSIVEQVPAEYMACIYSLRFDRIVAEIKLMIYRVSRSPRRFPWPTNLTSWQQEAEAACVSLLSEVQSRQRGRSSSGLDALSASTVQRLELKFHQCIMLLYRPSPQLPSPRLNAIQACFNSAMNIVKIHADLHRFSNMECSWLTAHSIFVAAITVLYCLWIHPGVRGQASLPECLARVDTALQLLTFLSQWWSVAHDPCQKLARLIELTREAPNHELRTLIPTGPGDLVSGQQAESAAQLSQEDGRSLLIDDLGILRDLFDLGWLNDWALDNVPAPDWDSSQLMMDLESGQGNMSAPKP
ncbi:transcription factor domain-containing protein [Aspergillus stella-maris]|uniref:transcription factor domain-containing protein n=1 Tax=Aspergillus stella-maris TaxID=1810926 RepID=UPI003CCD245A